MRDKILERPTNTMSTGKAVIIDQWWAFPSRSEEVPRLLEALFELCLDMVKGLASIVEKRTKWDGGGTRGREAGSGEGRWARMEEDGGKTRL